MICKRFHVGQNADLYILRVVHGNGIEGLRNQEEKKMRKLKRCSTLFASFMTIAMALTTTQLPIHANDMEPKVNDEKITEESEPELEKLKIIEGENASHSIGSGEDFIITTNQKDKDFTRMEMKTHKNFYKIFSSFFRYINAWNL